MKYHFTGFVTSALFHAALVVVALPLLLWQDLLEKPAVPQPVTLSLTQFQPAPPPPAEPPTPQPVAEPPKPEPKPVEKPKPEPKPLTKPKPKRESKPLEQPKPKPKPVEKPKSEPKPVVKPQTAAPVVPQPVIAQPTPHPVAPVVQAAPPAKIADNKAAEAAYRAKLQNLIAARKQYPRMAERAEVEGSVVVAFTVMPNGTITGARVAKSSGNDWLDKAALQAVNSASGALPFPPAIRKSQWAFSVTVNFRLE